MAGAPKWRLLLILILTSLWQLVICYNSMCTLPTPAAGQPPMLPQISPQFSVHVEASFLDKNSTMLFIEYFDYEKNRGKLRQIKDGETTDYFYDYSTNELLIVNPDNFTCDVQRLSTASYMFLLGDNNGHIFSPAAALRFSTQTGSPWVYIGKSQVRSINVNQWTNCIDWPSLNTTIQVVWSFVDNMLWTSSVSMTDIPVLCHVTGRVYTGEQQNRTFEHMYEFIHYFQNLPDNAQQIFETPSGIICPGRKNTKGLPALPDALSFVGETLDEQRKSITYTKERYDSRGRIVTYTFRGYTFFSNKYGNNPLGVVHDFNTGTEYVVDLLRGNCTIAPLTSTPDVAQGSDLVTSRLRDVASMLSLDGNFTYMGQRTVRGIPCDVWITQKSAQDSLGDTVNSTYEWAFSTPDWSYEYGSSGVSSSPIQVIYTLENNGSRQSAVTNVYDFVGNVPDVLEGFNLDTCFIGLPRNNIVLAFSRVYRTLLDYFKTQFKYAVSHSIAEAIDISPLRIANIQYILQDTSLTLSFDLLSVPSTHSTVQQPLQQVSLDDATSALVYAVTSNSLVVQLALQTGQPTYLVPDPHSLRVTRLNQLQVVTGRGTLQPIPTRLVPVPTPGPTRSPTARPTPRPTPRLTPSPRPQQNVSDGLCEQYVTDGYSGGAMAGSALALGIVGGALGFLTHRYLLRRE